jgi:hypothetical protein
MKIESQILNRFENGLVLEVVADELPVRAYVAICEPDIEAVTGFVPPEQFENGSNLHVAAIDSVEDVSSTLEDVLFNMEADDAVALLCADIEVWRAALEGLGYDPDATSLK